MNPATAIMLIKNLSERTPELIREINPATWFERLIHEGNQYKLAKIELEKEYAKDRDALKCHLAELETKKQAYIETLNHQIKLIEAADAPVMATLQACFNDLESINTRADNIHKAILENIGKIEIDFFNTLQSAYKSIFSERKTAYQQIMKTLENHRKSISETRADIAKQIENHQKALKDY